MAPKMTIPQVLPKKSDYLSSKQLSQYNKDMKQQEIFDAEAVIPLDISQRIGCKIMQLDLSMNHATIQYTSENTTFTEVVPACLPKLNANLVKFKDLIFQNPQVVFVDDKYFNMTALKLGVKSIPSNYLKELHVFTKQYMSKRNAVFDGEMLPQVAQFQSQLSGAPRQPFSEIREQMLKKLDSNFWLHQVHDRDHLSESDAKLTALKIDETKAKLLQLFADELFIDQVTARICKVFSQPLVEGPCEPVVCVTVQLADQKLNFQATIDHRQLEKSCGPFVSKPILHLLTGDKQHPESEARLSPDEFYGQDRAAENCKILLELGLQTTNCYGTVVNYQQILKQINVDTKIQHATSVAAGLCAGLQPIDGNASEEQLKEFKLRILLQKDTLEIGFMRISLAVLKEKLLHDAEMIEDVLKQRKRKDFRDQLQTIYMEMAVRESRFEQTISTPAQLVVLSQTIQELPAFLKDVLQRTFKLVDSVVDTGYTWFTSETSDDEATLDIVMQDLLKLRNRRNFTSTIFSVQQRVFSKMLLDLVDFMEYYAGQVQLMARDVQGMEFGQHNAAMTTRLSRWFFAGFNYKKLDEFFNISDEISYKFIESISQESGIEITKFDHNEFIFKRSQPIDIYLAMKELIYVCGALQRIYGVAKIWGTVLKTELFIVLDPNKLFEELKPIADLLLGVDVLQRNWEDSESKTLRQLDVNNLIDSADQIMQSIMTIRRLGFNGWSQKADEATQVIQSLYPKLLLVKALKSPHLTSFHFVKMSQIIKIPITADLDAKLIHINRACIDDRFPYVFENVNKILANAELNTEAKDVIDKISKFITGLKIVKVTVSETASAQYRQFFFTRFQGDLDCNKQFNQYILELTQLIQQDLNPLTQQWLREVEYNIIFANQYCILSSRSSVIIQKFIEQEHNYQQNSKLFEIQKIVVILLQIHLLFAEKIKNDGVPVAFTKNQSLMSQFSEALEQLDKIIYYPNPPVTDSMLLKLESKPPNLQDEFKSVMEMVRQNKFSEILENYCYQTVIQAIAHIDFTLLPKVVDVINNASEKLKARGEIYLKTIESRLKEMMRPDKVIITTSRKQHSLTQRMIQDVIGSNREYWLGDILPLEIGYLNEELYDCIYESFQAMKLGVPAILMGGRIRHYERPEIRQMLMFLSRIIGKPFNILMIGPGNNAQELNEVLIQYIQSNYTILLCGTEYMTDQQMNNLLYLCSMMQNRSGIFSNSTDFGGFIFFLPTVAFSLNYGNSELLITKQTHNVLRKFEARREVFFKANMSQEFSKFTEYHKEMQEISVYLSCMSSTIPNIRPASIPFIASRMKTNTKVAFANSVYCYLIHQAEESVWNSIKYVVQAAFNINMAELKNDILQFRETKQHDVFTVEGNFYFELAQYFVCQNFTAIVSPCKVLRHMIIETLAKVNSWKVFWITNQIDFENSIDDIQKDPENTLIVFLGELLSGQFVKSIYQHFITAVSPNQPYLIAGKYYSLPKLKVVAMMTNYSVPAICDTSLQLVFNKVFFDCLYMNQNYVKKNQVLIPFQVLKPDVRKPIIITIQDCQKFVRLKSIHVDEQQLAAIELKKKQQLELTEMLSKLLFVWFQECDLNLNVLFKHIKTWQMLRTLMLVEFWEVGILLLKPGKCAHTDPIELKAFLTTSKIRTAQLVGLKFFGFQFGNIVINPEILEFTDFEKAKTQLQLRVFACLLNALIVLFVCEWLNETDVNMMTLNLITACQKNTLLTDAAKLNIKNLKPPQTPYEYLREGKLVIDDETSHDSFFDEDDCPECELNWHVYQLGQDRYKRPAIQKFLQSDVDFEPQKWLSPKQTITTAYFAALIVGNYQFAINGRDQCGKTTLLDAAMSIVHELAIKESYVITKETKAEDLIEKVSNSLRTNAAGDLINYFPQIKVINIQVVNNGFQNEIVRDLLDFLLDQKTVFLDPIMYGAIRPNSFRNAKYSGVSNMMRCVVAIEIEKTPPSLTARSITVPIWTKKEIKQYIKIIDSKISQQDLDDFVTGIFLILPVLNCSLPVLFKQMYRFIALLQKDDHCQKSWNITAFMNALREMPHITNENIQKIIDIAEAALSAGEISKTGFWGGLDINNMIQLQQTDQQVFKKIQYHQYTNWELNTLKACEQATHQLNDDSEDEDENKDESKKSRLEYMKAAGRFRQTMVMKPDLKGIDLTIFDLFVASYKEFGTELDPNLCNKMLQMHVIAQSDLERNSYRLFEYFNALRAGVRSKIYELQNGFKLPIYVFYSKQMPANQYINQIQLLATLGNYQISNLQLFAQINSTLKQDEESSLNTSDSDSSSVSGSASSFSLSISSASQHSSLQIGKDGQIYNHNVNGRRQKRIIIDVETLIQQMMKDIKDRKDVKKEKHKLEDQLTEALQLRIQDSGESSLAGYIIRAAFCQSIGISPAIGLQNLNLNKPLQISQGGSVLPKFPAVNDIIQHLRDVLREQVNENFKSDDQNLQNLVRYNIIQDPIDVMTVVPMSRLIQGNDTQALYSLMQLASPCSSAIAMFSEQEMKVLGLLVAYNYNLDFLPTSQQILCIASRSFAVMIINDVNATHWQRIISTPTARHQVIEQKLNAMLSGQRDSISLVPLFKMSRVPLVNMDKMNIPNYIIEATQVKRLTQTYCKAVMTVYDFCENHSFQNHPAPSLNSFARYCKKLVQQRINNSVRFFANIDPMLSTLKTIDLFQTSHEYTGREREYIIKLRESLVLIKDLVQHDYLRNVELLKNAISDGVMIAARFLFFQYINPEYKSEKLFEIGLIDALRNEKITNMSINTHQQDQNDINDDCIMTTMSEYDFISNSKQNISGVPSQLIGLLLEQMTPHWDFTPSLASGLLQKNFLQEVTQLIYAKKLQCKFLLVRYDIAHQAIHVTEQYFQKVDIQTVKANFHAINCMLPYNTFCYDTQSAIESGKTILFENFGTQPEITSMLQEFMLLVMNKITRTNQAIKIGGVRVVIPKPLHEYGIYFSLKKGVSVAEMVTQGVFGMQICDTGILISPPYKVLNTTQIILEQLNKPNFNLILQDSVRQLSSFFKQYIINVKLQDISFYCEQRRLQEKIYQSLKMSAKHYVQSSMFAPGKFESNDTEILMSFHDDIRVDMQKRLGVIKQIADQAKLNKASIQLARAMTCCYLATAQIARFQSALGAVFIDHIWDDLGDYLKQHMTKNIQSDVMIGVMPYFLSKVLPLVPKKYHIQILAISYSMYMVAFDMADSSDLELIRHLFQVTYDGQKHVQQQALEKIDITKYPSLEADIVPPVFQANTRLQTSWLRFLAINQFSYRFDELYSFYERNYAKFAELVLHKSSIDRILGNYMFTNQQVADQLIPKAVQNELEKKILTLPLNMEQLNLKSIWSVCICSLITQTENGIKTMQRYSQLVPISPEKLMTQNQSHEKILHDEQIKKLGLFRGMFSEIASQLFLIAQKAMNKSKVVLVFHDTGMAIQEMCALIQIIMLEKRYVCTINPSTQQLKDMCVIQTTNHDVVGSLASLEEMWKNGNKPNYLLWVLVPQAWNQKIGQENIDDKNQRIDIQISNFCATTECEQIYIQRPQTFHETLSYYVTMGCGQFIKNKINVMTLKSEVQSIFFGLAQQYAKRLSKSQENVVDIEFVLQIILLVDRIVNNKPIYTEQYPVVKPMPIFRADGGQLKVKTPTRFAKIAELMHATSSLESTIALWLACEKENASCTYDEFMNQQLQVLPAQNDVKIFRDGLQFVVNKQFHSIFSEERIEHKEVKPKLDVIPVTLQYIIKSALSNSSLRYDAHFFTKQQWDVIELIGNEFRFRASVFFPVLGEMFYFIKVFNQPVTHTALHEMKTIILLEPPKQHFEICGSKIRPAKEPSQFMFMKVEDARFRNCSYDTEAKSICDCGDVEDGGFWYQQTLYLTVAVVSDDKFEDSNDFNGDKLTAIQFMGEGCTNRPYLYVLDKTGLGDEGWGAKGAHVSIGYF